jgi:hypothetical protein
LHADKPGSGSDAMQTPDSVEHVTYAVIGPDLLNLHQQQSELALHDRAGDTVVYADLEQVIKSV